MRSQNITKRKQRAIKPLWGLAVLLLGFALGGWLTPVAAQVTLCGEDLSPDPDGVYRLSGHLTCLSDSASLILDIDEPGAEFILRGFVATGDNEIDGIRIREGSDNVRIVGGNFKKCQTALRIDADNCEIKNFWAFDSSDKAISIRGNGNTIEKSICRKAGNDCFELRDGDVKKNSAKWCTAINSGTLEEGQGFSLRGPAYVYKCSAVDSSAEGFQIQEGVSDVTIEQSIAVNNALSGIAIKAEEEADGDFATGNTVKDCFAINNDLGGIVIDERATNNSIKRNTAFGNGDYVTYFDLFYGSENCDDNIWKWNKFRSRNPSCIH